MSKLLLVFLVVTSAVVAVTLSSASPGASLPQASNYAACVQMADGGSSSSAHYSTLITFGQPAAGTAQGANYRLEAGFSHACVFTGLDPDNDIVLIPQDNCPFAPNPGQQNKVHPMTLAGDHCDDPEADGVFDISDNCPDTANAGQENADGDPRGDACELAGCETIATAWTNPAGDAADCDGFPDAVTADGRGHEAFIGTDPADRCPDNSLDDAWPPDVNNNGWANLSDIVAFGPHFNTISPDPGYSPRVDLNASGAVNLSDIVLLGPFFNKACTP